MTLKALALNCTLKADGDSSTQRMIDLVLASLERHGVTGRSIRLAKFNVKPGVTSTKARAMIGQIYASKCSWPTS